VLVNFLKITTLAAFGVILAKSGQKWLSLEWVVDHMDIGAKGYVVLFGLLFACGLGLPLPEDIPLLVAGTLIGRGSMHLVVAAVIAWCGIIGGDCVLYSLGKRYGLNITKLPVIGKHVTQERILRAEHLFERWGTWVVAVGRLFAGIRGAMVIAAGAIRFNFIKFVIADGLAAVVSGGLFLFLGYVFGHNLKAIEEKIHKDSRIIFAVVAVAAIALIAYVAFRKKKHAAVTDVALATAEHKIGPHHVPPRPAGPAAPQPKPEP
jgi:membrane protein DedA with SNARE-associated domain